MRNFSVGWLSQEADQMLQPVHNAVGTVTDVGQYDFCNQACSVAAQLMCMGPSHPHCVSKSGYAVQQV